MIARCTNPRNGAWDRYGGRGISVCNAWRESFDTFIRDVGARPSMLHSIDRINNDGHYEPGNVRWATAKEQCRNTSRNYNVTAFGETMCVAAWAERVGMPSDTLLHRLANGWPNEEAISTPWRPRGSELTDRQRFVLELISRGHDAGSIPTLRELGSKLDIASTNGVNDHLRCLERKGFIERDDIKSRGIRLVLPPPDFEDLTLDEEDLVAGLATLSRDRLRGIVALAMARQPNVPDPLLALIDERREAHQ